MKHPAAARPAAIAETGWAYDRKDSRISADACGSSERPADRAGYNYATYFFDGKDE
ncbi:MAG: hypothetical protein ACLUNS_02070 [Alistipes shahii]